MLEIRGLTKQYRNKAVVDDVSFTVRPGELTGYLQRTARANQLPVKMITTLIEPTRGQVLIDGRDIRGDLAASSSGWATSPKSRSCTPTSPASSTCN